MAREPNGAEEPRSKPARNILERFFTRLGCAWDVAQDLGQVLKYTRLSLIVTLLAGLILIFVGPGQELVLIQAENFWAHWAFYPAVVFWALNAWYWARATLTYGAEISYAETCPERPYLGGRLKRVLWLVKHVPRLIGAGAFFLIAFAQLKVAGREGLLQETVRSLKINALAALTLALLFYLFVLKRRAIARWLRAKLDPNQTSSFAQTWLEIPDRPDYDPKASVMELPATARELFSGLVIVLLFAFVLALADPVTLGDLGPEVIFLAGASLWIAPGTWALFIARRGDLPLVTIVLALGLAFSFINDNHALRTVETNDTMAPGKRPTPTQALEDRSEENQGQALVMVATAGGGSRAAYWTATLLGTISDLHPDFERQLFGISGVSGGSLGAVVYRGLLTALPQEPANCEERAAPDIGKHRACARAILGEDFLGAALAGSLFPDLVQRILPRGLLPDRAAALERAWERAWARAMGDQHPRAKLMAADFFRAWPGEGGRKAALPALFLNGTSVATGKRIVTSNLDVARDLTDAFDLFEHWPVRIPLSTAANNSARFPLLAPAGTLKREPTEDDPNTIDRVVDGGYFENFGAATALDILERLVADGSDRGRRLPRLVVIQISSDPNYMGVDRGESGGGRRPEASPGSFAGELLSPVKTLLNTRKARGVLAAQRLYDWTNAKQGAFFEFRLIRSETESDPPLGWTLSEQARRNIDCQLTQTDNWAQLEGLAEGLDFSLEGLKKQLEESCQGG